MQGERQAASRAVEREDERLSERVGRYMRYSQTPFDAYVKTYQFFLLTENKELTKIISLTGNDLETSGLLYSAMFCTNQKNAFLICKSSVFIPYYQSYPSEE